MAEKPLTDRQRTEQLAKMIRKRLRTLALDAPEDWRAIMEAEADALAELVREFNSRESYAEYVRDEPAP